MLLATVLILKICLGQSAFVSIQKSSNKTSIHASDSQKNIAISIANTEIEEDENEENNTKDLFIELHYLNVFFNQVNLTSTYLFSHQISYTYPLSLLIFKAINCFRI